MNLATLLILVGVLIALLVFAHIVRLRIQKKTKTSEAFKRDILLVTLAKEAEEQAEKEEAQSSQKKDLKEAIAISETLYANLEGAGFTKDWSYWKNRIFEFWTGQHRHISFEMIVQNGLIKFLVVTPHYLSEYTEQQIEAIYPTAQVEKVPDYNIFGSHSCIVGTYLKLTQNTVLPIRTYKNLDTDPLDGITNTLSKVLPDEGVAVQILIRPAQPKWRQKAWKITKKMHHGKSFYEAANTTNNWIYVAFSLPIKAIEFILKEIFSANSTKKEDQAKKPEDEKKAQNEEEIIKLIEANNAKTWFETNIRVIVSTGNKIRSNELLRNLINSFSQFKEQRISNGFASSFLIYKGGLFDDFIYRNFSEGHKVVLSSEELSSIYHFPLSSSETPNIAWLTTRKAAPPMNLPETGTILGRTLFRGVEKKIRILREDRRRHVYIIGKSGMGKSVLIEQMAKQDIQNGEGVCMIDPHGDTAEALLTYVPPQRVDDVVYFNPGDTERPIGLNMLEAETPEEMDFVTQEMIAIFYQLVTDPSMIGPMFEHYMRNAMFTLMANKENPGTLADIPRIFTDTEFQTYSLQFVTDPLVRSFWEKEMAQTSDNQKSEMLGYLISKVGRFIENGLMRNIIGQPKSGFDLSEIMDKKKILLVNLSKGKIGDINSNLLGLILVSKLTLAALRRASQMEEARSDFYLYIDEFQNYITDSIATILSEARKYKLNLTIAHQYMGQLVKNNDAKIREAVLGNVGTMVSFKIGIEDAEVLAKEFAPTVNAYDLVNVEKQHAYIKLLVENQSTRAFTMQTVMGNRGERILAEKLKELSRLRFGRDRKIIEREILERTKLGS